MSELATNEGTRAPIRQSLAVPVGPLTQFLETDHLALGLLLEQAMGDPIHIDLRAYEAFRNGLLRHIAAEGKVLLPAVRAANGGQPIALAARLKRDHAALAVLLVPTPTREILATLARILVAHMTVEEGDDGVFATCERMLTGRSEVVAEQMRAVPRVHPAPHMNTPLVESHVRRLVGAALSERAPQAPQHGQSRAA